MSISQRLNNDLRMIHGDAALNRVDIDAKDIPLLDLEAPEQKKTEPEGTTLANEASLTANFADFSSPINRRHEDKTDLSKDGPMEDSLLKSGDDATHDKVIGDNRDYVPSAVVNYYNESALKAKTRKSLDDSEFGIPRLRAYPLNDRAHVKAAIRMFNHCKDPEDRKTLAKNIFAAMSKHGVDMKIGKKNGLYEYAPESLKENVDDVPGFTVAGFEKKESKRTKEDVVREHLAVNGSFYNNIFYGNEYAKAAKGSVDLEFLEYFYPSLAAMDFAVHLQAVCGGMLRDADAIYKTIGIRAPLDTDFTKPIGWSEASYNEAIANDFELMVNSYYDSYCNWFKVNLISDLDHIHFCLRLYSIMGEILLNPNFSQTATLTDRHHALLMDWGQRVSYHYDLYLDADNENDRLREIQYLFDLFWDYRDNPYNEDDVMHNVLIVLRNMTAISDQVVNMNEANNSGELINKEHCNAYLAKELGLGDDLYLLPNTMKFPIIDKNSIRLAMDMVGSVSAADRDQFVANLNRKYKEFGCTFSISVDHPYAKYADKNIVSHMTHMLLEGKTAVDDQGTSVAPEDRTVQPWYKKVNIARGISGAIEKGDNVDLGPNRKKNHAPDYAYLDSEL